MLKKKLLIFIVAYNAEKTIKKVLYRIPHDLQEKFDTEVLVIDDSSKDNTFKEGNQVAKEAGYPFKLTVLYNPVNQGYGGNQKLGYHYAMINKFDFVALVHGDGQYAPESLPVLLEPLVRGEADAVFGSRMISRFDSLRGGMPLYKYAGNKILTFVQNFLLKTNFSEFHSGYRIYSVKALTEVPFDKNSNVFHFDTEIIIQFVFAGKRIKELSIPTYYGDEICNVDGLKYAKDVILTTLKAYMQKYGLLYDIKFDCTLHEVNYKPKIDFAIPHRFTIDRVKPGSRVLDIGCANGYIARELKKKGCYVIGMDVFEPIDRSYFDEFILFDANNEIPISTSEFDYILLLDIVEHLNSPERFVEKLRSAGFNNNQEIIVSTGNVGFALTRLGLLFGSFNYGKRGILDITHTRLFTFSTIQNLFSQAGFSIGDVQGAPVPIPLVIKNRAIAKFLLGVNQLLLRLFPRLFSFQTILVAKALPTTEYLLSRAVEHRTKHLMNESSGIEKCN